MESVPTLSDVSGMSRSCTLAMNIATPPIRDSLSSSPYSRCNRRTVSNARLGSPSLTSSQRYSHMYPLSVVVNLPSLTPFLQKM